MLPWQKRKLRNLLVPRKKEDIKKVLISVLFKESTSCIVLFYSDFEGAPKKDIVARKRKLTLEFKTKAAEYASINGVVAAAKHEIYGIVKERTLRDWLKDFKANKVIEDKRGDILILSFLNFNSFFLTILIFRGSIFWYQNLR